MAKLSKQARDEFLAALRQRYRSASATDKGRVLDEVVALTGYHRKHAIRLLRESNAKREARAVRSRVYDDAVREAIGVLWEAADRICAKRLRALLAVLVPALERHGHLALDETVRHGVFTLSAETMDRLLRARRLAAGKQRRHTQRPRVAQAIPMRTFADWGDPPPGLGEIDLVAHCGDRLGGSFVHTPVLTDIASGWIECVPLLVRHRALVTDALERLRTTMPFALGGIDSDNGSEFINDALTSFCAGHRMQFTRSRPYRENDQTWVEQKNGAVMRCLVGLDA